MTKEELKKLSRENLRKSKQGSLCECYDEAFIKGYELSEKRIEELEHQLIHRNCVDCSNHSSKLKMRTLELEQKLEQAEKDLADYQFNYPTIKELSEENAKLEEENVELKEKFLTVKKDDVRKAKLNDCKTYEEKVEYLRQVANYAIFNEDISVMFWCFCQRGQIDTDQLTEARQIILKLYNAGRDVLMCRNEEKAYDNLDKAINDKSIEQFIRR